jgi:alpha-mannosidase
MDQGWHRMHFRLAPHAGAWQDARVPRKAWALNEPPAVHIESAHPGTLPLHAAFMETDAENVILTVLKFSDEGGDLIVRGYETDGVGAEVCIRWPHLRTEVTTHFAPHEIKTLRITPGTWEAREVNFLEE